MSQIVVADVEAYDPAIYGTRTLRFATQPFVTGSAPIADPAIDSRIAVTRAGTATRVNGSGVIESVAANTARIDYDPVTRALRGLLVEESRANLLLNSTINGANLATQTVSLSAVAHTLSFYGSGSVVLSGAATGTIAGAGAYPARATLTFTPTAGNVTFTVTGTVQFAQLEVGSTASSYIPTAGASVTRNRDDLVISGSNFSPWYNSPEGTLFSEWEQGTTAIVIPAAITDGTVSNRLSIVGGTTIGGRITVAGVATDPAAATGGAGVHRSAIALKSADSVQFTNGSINSAVSPSGTPSVNRLELGGQPATSSAYLNGWIRRVHYWPTRLSNTQMAALTSGQSVPDGASLILNFVDGAHEFYDGRIQQPANIQRFAFRDGRTFGRTQVGFGEMVLVNNDGALDGMLNYSFSGRRITIRLGVISPNANGIPTWVNVIRGTMEQAEFSWQKVTVRVRDRQQDLTKPIQQNRYAGGGGTLEGQDTDIKDKPKPLVFGKLYNIAPPQVNTSLRIYQLHEGQLGTVDAVFDRGVLLTAGAAYTSQADMTTNAPAAGQYRVWNDATAGCFIRLGSQPSGTVTADVTRGGTITVGQMFNAILLKAGIAASDISSADITALDAAVNYQAGVYAGFDRDYNALELLDEMCASVGAWYGCDAFGVFRIGRIELPTGTEVGSLTTTDILKIERIASRDPGVGVPAWRVKLAYQKVQTVQPDLSNVPDGHKNFVSQQYRRQQAEDATVKVSNILSPELEFRTVLWNKADALAEAQRLLTIYKTRRDVYEVTIRVDSALASVLDIGRIVQLQVNRFGMSSGKKFLIIGLRSNLRNYQFDLTLWG